MKLLLLLSHRLPYSQVKSPSSRQKEVRSSAPTRPYNQNVNAENVSVKALFVGLLLPSYSCSYS